MKTLEQLYLYKSGPNASLDGRDVKRLVSFIPVADWSKFNLAPVKGVDPATIQVEPLTRENVLKHLASDLAFAFGKATGKRGISSSLMWDVIKMWMWVLDDELADFPDNNYPHYGLPLLKAVAVKYGLDNPIGDDEGTEDKYAPRF